MSVRHLFAAWAAADRADPPDRDLIDRFRRTRDDAAFAHLVRRHGPMVWGVCRRVVGDTHAAEDAFQATFLVLVLRADAAAGVRELGGWLHAVAVRTATRARSRHRRALDRERPTDPLPHPPAADAPAADWLPLLDEELARLADKYRQPVLLCDLQGVTLRDAAARLGVPVGTLSERLGRARQSLAARLARRGVVPAVGLTLAATDPPVALAASTVERAVLVACGGADALPILGLSKGVVRAMWWGKLKATAAAAVVVGGLGAGVGGWLTAADGPARPAAVPADGPPKVVAGLDRPQVPAKFDLAGFVAAVDEGNNAAWTAARAQLKPLTPAETSAVVVAAWDRLPRTEARRELARSFTRELTAGNAAAPLLDVLDKAMRDKAAVVRNSARYTLLEYALRDFATDFTAYEAWYQTNRSKTRKAVVTDAIHWFAANANKADLRPLAHTFRDLARDHGDWTHDVVREAKVFDTLLRMVTTPAPGAKPGRDDVTLPGDDRDMSRTALYILGHVHPTEEQLKQHVLPLATDPARPWLHSAAVQTMTAAAGKPPPAWLLTFLRDSLTTYPKATTDDALRVTQGAAEALAACDDAASIPTMIAIIDSDNTYGTVYGVGYFALGKLTGVEYDERHDGKWWREWWGKNKQRFGPAVAAMTIPDLPKVVKKEPAAAEETDDPLADVKDVPSVEKTVGGDAMKRYIVVGKTADAPAGGRKLLLVLPGGDGSAEFNPFLRRVWKNALGNDWVLVQAVAPSWIVWPTEKRPNQPFTVEPFLEGIVAEVSKGGGIDPKHVYLLGWSSGGPACYATLLRDKSPFRGAMVAMSVFRPEALPPLAGAKGKPVYLLQSPDDNVTRMAFAEAAEKQLTAAGATVTLVKYDGGHGWRGNPFEMIGDGAKWLAGAK